MENPIKSNSLPDRGSHLQHSGPLALKLCFAALPLAILRNLFSGLSVADLVLWPDVLLVFLKCFFMFSGALPLMQSNIK